MLPAEPLTLRSLFAIVVRHRQRIAVSFLVALSLAALAAVALPNLYTGDARMLVRQLGDAGLNRAVAFSGLPNEAALETEIQMLQSADLGLRVLEALPLVDPPAEGEEPAVARAQALDAFRDKLVVEPVGLSRVISVRYTHRDPELAAAAANTVVQGYIDIQRETKARAATVAAEWLNERIAGASAQARLADLEVERFRRESGLLESRGLGITSQQVSELNSQLSLATADLAAADARLTLVTDQVESGTDRDALPLASPQLDRLREAIARNARELSEASEVFGPLHPLLVNLRSRTADLRTQLEEEQTRLIAQLGGEVAVARTRETSLRASIAGFTSQLAALNTSEIRLRALEREAQAAGAQLEDMLARAKEVGSRTDSQMQTVDASFVARADVPVVPSFPPRPSLFVLAIFLAAVVGVGWALLAENLTTGFLDEKEVRRLTGLPCLGRVPRLRVSWRSAVRERFSHLFSNTAPLPHLAHVQAAPEGMFAEAIRIAHCNATLQPGAGLVPRSIMFTAAQRGEGVSTMVATLAAVQAQAGLRVVVIDAHLRAPRLGKTFGAKAQAGGKPVPGLVAALAGDASLDACVRPARDDRIHLLRADEPAHGRAVTLLAGPAWRPLVEQLSRDYDLVLVDAPPMATGTATQALSRGVDSTIFVAKWADTPRTALLASLEQLHGADINGVVLQMADRAGPAYMSYPAYGA